MSFLNFRVVFLLVFCCALSGCFIDSSKDPSANVSLVSVSSPEAVTFSPGQPFSVDFSVKTERIEADHVGVSFFIIESSKASQLINNEEAEEFDVGEFYIESLVEGTQNYTAELMVPNDLVASGEYIVVAYLDAAGVIGEERTKNDNLSQNVTAASDPTFGSMQIDLEHHHDFILSKIEIGEGFLLLPEPVNHDETESGLPDTDHSDLIGFIDAIKHGSNVDTAIVTGVITVAGVDYPAHFWHEDEDTYTDSMDLVFPNHEEEHYFPFDIALNGELVHALADAYDPNLSENTLALTLTIVDTSATAEEDDTNNTQTIDLPYVFFEDDDVIASKGDAAGFGKTGAGYQPSGKITSRSGFYEISNDFGHTYGDKSKVALQISFDDSVTLTAANGGAAAEANGYTTLYMFNKSATLFSAELSGEVLVGALDGEYELSVELLGQTLLDESDTVYEFSEEWSREWSEETTIFETTFTIVIVPITVSAGIEGHVGFGAGLEADSGVVTATGTPFSAGLDAFAEASINLLVASGGVRADFLIFSEELTVEAYADASEFVFGGDFSVGLTIENELKAIEGNFSLFVRYPKYKFCCKVQTKEASKTIYNTGALYDKTWTLLDLERTINLF